MVCYDNNEHCLYHILTVRKENLTKRNFTAIGVDLIWQHYVKFTKFSFCSIFFFTWVICSTVSLKVVYQNIKVFMCLFVNIIKERSKCEESYFKNKRT